MTDVNKPIENPKLRALLEERKNTAPDGQASVNNRIAEEVALHAQLLAVIQLDPNAVEVHEDGKAVIQKDTRLTFVMFNDQKGNTFMPVFTDWPSLYAGDMYKDRNVQTLIVGFDDIAAITGGHAGAVINPFTDNVVITPPNLAHMKMQKEITLNGVSKQEIKKDTTVQIGDPAEVPYEMIQAINAHAESDKTINAIWLKLMIKDGEQSYLLIVDHTGNPDEVFKGIADAAVPHIHNGMYVDMMEYNSPTGKKAARGNPIYRKQKRFLFA